MPKINYQDKNYPTLLKEIHQPPDPLFYKGNLPGEDQLMVGVVGTRGATDRGKKIAKNIAKDLSNEGITVVSGLALGVDGAAHRATLETNQPTVAVLANGLDIVYPKEHKELADQIISQGGCLISEYSPGTPPRKPHFLQRNRIISGLSAAIVVIEAPSRSGALSTARHAVEQNREVFVVPGPPEEKNYSGSHKLLRNGARLATNAKEILKDLNILENQKRLV